jgi:pimeloyl-ACP methyl ester carboxylesterase
VTTFALVHGAWHGAWCWEPLVGELEARGHRAVAVDLPCDDVTAGLDAYASTVLEAVEGVAGDELVVVGHSLGGITIPIVADRRPVSRLVFVCALIPRPGRPLADVFTDSTLFVPGPSNGTRRDDQGRSYWPDPAVAIEAMYPDCGPTLAQDAAARLRPQAAKPSNDPSPLQTWPDVPVTSIVCDDDLMLAPAWLRRAARELLGVEPIDLPGSHSPMLARPGSLADALTSAP